jgi:hypothetical protein
MSVSVNDFYVPRSPRCGRRMVCLGGGRLERIGAHFWKGNTTQMSSIDLGRTLRKLHAAFRTFQHQFSPGGNRNQCTHAAALSPPSWNATLTVVDVHPRASTERMWGDTDLRFCTYTCTELPHVPLCCHFATYYNFPEKNSVPELNDQPTYSFIWEQVLRSNDVLLYITILSDKSRPFWCHTAVSYCGSNGKKARLLRNLLDIFAKMYGNHGCRRRIIISVVALTGVDLSIPNS